MTTIYSDPPAETPRALDPRSIANAIIGYARERDSPITHLSVQKLLFFAHATYLVRNRTPLVSGYFEAWDHGPVHRVIYDSLKRFSREPIIEPIRRRDPFSGEESEIPAPTHVQVRDHIVSIMMSLGRLSAGRLVELSHVEGGPWHYVWNKSQTERVFGNRISDNLILERFVRLNASLSVEPRFGDLDEAEPIA